ncbi:50S ribosomal protein L24 [Candidatus Woesearchaeota archaeon]|nr:50S ribosomal protein L24 [Candidatus Woesearchaeota archaeon]
MRKFSKAWKGSKKPRKQHKYRAKAPLHLRKNLVSIHLSKDLIKKYGKRNVPVRKGDKVKILRGQFRKKEGKIERIDRKSYKVYITGIELVKKEGSKVLKSLDPSNLIIVDLNLEDKKRKTKLETKKK